MINLVGINILAQILQFSLIPSNQGAQNSSFQSSSELFHISKVMNSFPADFILKKTKKKKYTRIWMSEVYYLTTNTYSNMKKKDSFFFN